MIKFGFSSPFDMFVEKKRQAKQKPNRSTPTFLLLFFSPNLLTKSKASTKTPTLREIPPLQLQCPFLWAITSVSTDTLLPITGTRLSLLLAYSSAPSELHPGHIMPTLDLQVFSNHLHTF